jgi:arylsulfatase A-like enzyme
VVIYTSDNGYICGSHGYGSKVLPMEESSRVPLIVYAPGSPFAGKQVRCDRLTGNIDMAATILELAGLEIPSQMDGKSLLGLLEQPREGGHDQLAFINVYGPLATHSLSCFTRQYKYTYWWYGDETMEPVEELFDTIRDPLELVNLATQPARSKTLESMRQRYDEELAAWKKQAVAYNDYQRYGTLFDRTTALADKAELMRQP